MALASGALALLRAGALALPRAGGALAGPAAAGAGRRALRPGSAPGLLLLRQVRTSSAARGDAPARAAWGSGAAPSPALCGPPASHALPGPSPRPPALAPRH